MWENKGITRTKKMLVAETDKMLYLGQPVVRNPSKYLLTTYLRHRAALVC